VRRAISPYRLSLIEHSNQKSKVKTPKKTSLLIAAGWNCLLWIEFIKTDDEKEYLYLKFAVDSG